MSGGLAPSGMLSAVDTFAIVSGFALAALMLAGAGMAGYQSGFAEGRIHEFTKDRKECVRREDRQFVDTGWFRSGEITTHNICVEWKGFR